MKTKAQGISHQLISVDKQRHSKKFEVALKNKKAQGISMNFIVIAMISLLVLIVIAFTVGNNFKRFGVDTTSCTNKGGQCTSNTPQGNFDDATGCPAPIYLRISGTSCEKEMDSSNEPKICCVPIAEQIKKDEPENTQQRPSQTDQSPFDGPNFRP